MKTIGIIPARYNSTRFPGKPLYNIFGKPMIQHVYDKASAVLDDVIVATDDKRIFEVVNKFGKCIITSSDHISGTDRCMEALDIIQRINNTTYDYVINIQGDEPFINTMQIKKIDDLLKTDKADIATLVKKISSSEDIFDFNKVKVVLDKNKTAIYFSRSAVPYLRDVDKNDWHLQKLHYKHIGLYGFKSNILLEISKLKNSILEAAESLEQLKWIENDYKISAVETDIESIGIDTIEDLNTLIH